jgi:excisionase family DNA binding protein
MSLNTDANVGSPNYVIEPRATLPALLTVKEAAAVRRCHVQHIYVLLGKGRIRGVKDGRKTFVVTQSLLDDIANMPAAKISWPSAYKKPTAPVADIAPVPHDLVGRGRKRAKRKAAAPLAAPPPITAAQVEQHIQQDPAE